MCQIRVGHTYAFSAFCFERKFWKSSCADIWHMKFNLGSHNVNPLTWARKREREIYIFLTGIEVFFLLLFWVSLSSLNQNLYQATKTPVSQLMVSNAPRTVNRMSSLRMVRDFYEPCTLSVLKSPRPPWVTSHTMHRASSAYTFSFLSLISGSGRWESPCSSGNCRGFNVKSTVGFFFFFLMSLWQHNGPSWAHLATSSLITASLVRLSIDLHSFKCVRLLNTVSQRML